MAVPCSVCPVQPAAAAKFELHRESHMLLVWLWVLTWRNRFMLYPPVIELHCFQETKEQELPFEQLQLRVHVQWRIWR